MIPFDDETVARVAAEHGVSEAALREAARDVQATLEDSGRSVDGLVYEWRQAFRGDPLLARRPDAWMLAVPEHAWVDVKERAGASEAVVDALVALYATEANEEREGVMVVIARE